MKDLELKERIFEGRANVLNLKEDSILVISTLFILVLSKTNILDSSHASFDLISLTKSLVMLQSLFFFVMATSNQKDICAYPFTLFTRLQINFYTDILPFYKLVFCGYFDMYKMFDLIKVCSWSWFAVLKFILNPHRTLYLLKPF
jgi:hypothetical protein